jgi:hypothetical protein
VIHSIFMFKKLILVAGYRMNWNSEDWRETTIVIQVRDGLGL